MKTKFRNRLIAITLSVMMTAAPVWGTAHAADDVIADQPEKPVAESYEDNDKIADYNNKVDDYNKAAKEHNDSVDREVLEAEETVTAMVEDLEVPMAGTAANESWAFLNLVIAILTAIASAVLMVGYYGRKENDSFARLMSIFPAIGALIIFAITEDLSNGMALVDKWTILMAAVLLIQAVVAFAAKMSEDKKEDEEVGETVNA